MFQPDTPIGGIGERALIHYLRNRIPGGPGVQLGVGDDAAALETGPLTLVTTDTLVEGVHFLREWTPPRLLGRKALAINLSDVAAMAGVPRYATVSLCLPTDLPFGFVEGLYDGLLGRAAEAGVSLVGGNLAATGGPIVVDITLLGAGERPLSRSGAKPGDLAVVTGTLGAAGQGLRMLRKGARLGADGELVSAEAWGTVTAGAIQHCLRAQLDPTPPLALGRALAEQEHARAAIDISDGLSGDLLAVCVESGVSARVDRAGLPVDPQAASLAKTPADAMALALHGGEDYQLLLAVPPDRLDAARELAGFFGIALSVVADFAPGPPGLWLREGETLAPLVPESHEHFRAARGASGE